MGTADPPWRADQFAIVMSFNEDKCIIYVATGEFYVSEAALSAQRSRVFDSSVSYICYTNLVEYASQFEVFDLVLEHPCPVFSYRDKLLPLVDLPADYCIFLDSDAALVRPSQEIFDLLTNNHCLAAYAPVRHPSGWSDSAVPALFPELNTGVLLLRRSQVQKDFIQAWLSKYDICSSKYNQLWDQASFRSCLWDYMVNHGLRFQHLPSEANFRLTKPWVAGKGLPVHVVHGRVPDDEWYLLLEYLNGNTNIFRTWNEWLRRYPSSALKLKIPPQPLG